MVINDSEKNNEIFIENEEKANQYAANCLIIVAAIVGSVWILNSINFFIISKMLMNIAMPTSITLFLLPSLLVKMISGQKLVPEISDHGLYHFGNDQSFDNDDVSYDSLPGFVRY